MTTKLSRAKLHIFSFRQRLTQTDLKLFLATAKFFSLPNGILRAIRCNKPNALTPSRSIPYTPFFANKR